MKTIAQQLNVTKFPFEIRDKNGNVIYFEASNGFWTKKEFDKNGNQIYYEDSNGFWSKSKFGLKHNNETYYENSNGSWQKSKFDKNGNQIYYENSNGFWVKKEFDKNGNQIYYENSYGTIIDNRPKSIQEYTMEELTKILGKPFKIVNMKTKAQQLDVTEFPFEIKDKNGNRIYFEYSNGGWSKREFDENSNRIYFEDSNGYWSKAEFDKNHNVIYFENSSGYIIDNRPKPIVEYTMEELTNILGKPFKIVK